MCKKNDIIIYKLTTITDGYSFEMASKDYKKLLSYNEKVKTTVKVIDKRGLPYFFYKYRKRKIFVLCFLLFILSIFILSNYIWNISVVGNETYTKEELYKDINDNYISIGTPKNKIDCNKLEQELRDKYTKLAWISCEIKGTNLILHIEETIPTDQALTISEPCNIIAYKDAIITDIIVNRGSKVVNIGDEIKKNDILITGVVNIYNEYEELIETNYTAAQGSIWGIVEYNYKDEFSMEINEKAYTGNSQSKYSLLIANKELKLPSKKLEFHNYDIISENKKIKIFNNLYLPFGLNSDSYIEYNISATTMTSDEAKKMAENRLILYIDNLKKKGVSILENNVTISIVNGKCTASGIIVCKEVIGIPAKLDTIQEGEQK